MGPFRDFGRSAKTSIMDMGKDTKEPIQSVQVFGRKKTATAVAYCKLGWESFVSMVNLWNKLNPNLSNSNYKSQFCFSEKTDSPKLTSGSELRVVDASLKFMLSDKLCPSL